MHTIEDSITAADRLLALIVQYQPGLLNSDRTSEGNGATAAKVIKDLRSGLIEMYQKTPEA